MWGANESERFLLLNWHLEKSETFVVLLGNNVLEWRKAEPNLSAQYLVNEPRAGTKN